mgnify:CR=1 FL=1
MTTKDDFLKDLHSKINTDGMAISLSKLTDLDQLLSEDNTGDEGQLVVDELNRIDNQLHLDLKRLDNIATLRGSIGEIRDDFSEPDTRTSITVMKYITYSAPILVELALKSVGRDGPREMGIELGNTNAISAALQEMGSNSKLANKFLVNLDQALPVIQDSLKTFSADSKHILVSNQAKAIQAKLIEDATGKNSGDPDLALGRVKIKVASNAIHSKLAVKRAEREPFCQSAHFSKELTEMRERKAATTNNIIQPK